MTQMKKTPKLFSQLFGERLRKRRRELGMNPHEVATAIRLEGGWKELFMMENGKRLIKVETIKKIQELFKYEI